MNGTSGQVQIFPFLVGAALGSLVGVLIGALLGGTLGHAIETATEGAVDKVFGRRDDELRFELLMQ